MRSMTPQQLAAASEWADCDLSLWEDRTGAFRDIEVLGFIGRGGYSAVYEGRTVEGTQVALKFFHRTSYRDEAEVSVHAVPYLSPYPPA